MKRRIAWSAIIALCLCTAGCGITKQPEPSKVESEDTSVVNEHEIEETVSEIETEETESKSMDTEIESIALETETEPEETESASEEEETRQAAERIICWGDSLTYGQGGNGVTYPSVLESKLNLTVVNYGIQGETARQIGIRMGLLPMTAGTFEIPSETNPVEVSLWQNGEDPIMMRLGDCGINPCRIAGVEGTLSYEAADNKYYFTRREPGTAVLAPEGSQVETFASGDKRESDIIVIFAGSNLPPNKDTVGELIQIERQMLEYLGAERYIIIGLTSKTLIPDVEAINQALAAEFGEHFLDIRAYFLEHGLADAGLQPTEQDRMDLAAGEIPSGIRVDEIHGNEAFYRMIGEQVYQKLEQLGYISEQEKK